MPNVLWPNGSAEIPRVTSEYGWRIHPITGIRTLHAGIDCVGWSIIKAPSSGTITFAGYNGGAGNEVRMRADGPNAFVKGTVYRLMHNRIIYVRAGQRVAQAQDLAVMGTTGASTGVHCHFETRPNGGAAVNPRDFMRTANAGSTGGGTTPSKPKPNPTPVPVPNTKEREDMTSAFIYTEKNSDGALISDRNRRGATIDTVSGLVSATSYFSVAYANGIAQGLGQTKAIPLTDKGFDAMVADIRALKK